MKLDFEFFTLRRFGEKNEWLVEWKTTGLIEYIGDHGESKYIATQLADRLEEISLGNKTQMGVRS